MCETLIHLWDVDGNKELSSHAENTTPTALAFSPDGARLAGTMASVRRSGGLSGIGSFDWGHKIQIWEVNSWKEVLTIQHPKKLAPLGVAFSPNTDAAWAHRLAVIWKDGMDRKTLSLYALTGNPQGMELLTIGEGITGTQPAFDTSGSRFSCDAGPA